MNLSRHTQAVKPSQTLQFNKKALEMIRAGIDVIKLTAGEPDFNTPEEIVDAANDAMRRGYTKYTDSTGIVELREAIARKLREDNGLDFDPGEIVVTNGGKQALYSLFKATINDGDEVILITPCWVSYEAQVKMNGGKPVFVTAEEDDGFVPDPAVIERAISTRTTAIVINSPNNPTGAVYSRQFLKELARLSADHDLLVISDEVYEKLIFEGSHESIASEEGMKERSAVVNGFSKSHAMTGWRIGYLAAPRHIAEEVAKIQDHLCSNVNTIAQHAALRAFSVDNTRMLEAFRKRKQVLSEGLQDMGLQFVIPRGAFYFFVDVKGFLGSDYADSLELAIAMLEKARVGVIPGSAFSYEGYIRLSYATSEDDIREAIQRMGRFFGEITAPPS